MNTNFITLSYWFDGQPGNLAAGALKLIAIFLAGLFLVTIVAYLKTKNKKDIYYKGWIKLITFTITNLVLGLLILFIYYEAVPYLSMRIIGLIWLISMIAWGYTIFRTFKVVPENIEKRKKEQEFKKYIP